MNSDLTVLIHGIWTQIGYASNLGPRTIVAQIQFEFVCLHSPGKIRSVLKRLKLDLSHFSLVAIVFLFINIRNLSFCRFSWASVSGNCPQLCVFCSASSGESVFVSVFILLLCSLPCLGADWSSFWPFSLLSLLSHLDRCTLRLLAENERVATFSPALRDRLAQAQDTCTAKVYSLWMTLFWSHSIF